MKELLYLKDEQIKDLIEQLFYAYRETFGDSKKILEKHSLGLAHQRVIHMIDRYEGITVSGLLKKLKVTKQSLNRILKDLSKNPDFKDLALIKLSNFFIRKENRQNLCESIIISDSEICNVPKARVYFALP